MVPAHAIRSTVAVAMRDTSTVAVYDLDSTVASTQHRWHLSPHASPESSWEAYEAACLGDQPIPGVIRRMKLDWLHHQVHIITGRSGAAEGLTRDWLNMYCGTWYDELRMAPAGQAWTQNVPFKIRHITRLQDQGLQVVLVYEDWPDAAAAITAATSVPCLVVNPCYQMPFSEVASARENAARSR